MSGHPLAKDTTIEASVSELAFALEKIGIHAGFTPYEARWLAITVQVLCARRIDGLDLVMQVLAEGLGYNGEGSDAPEGFDDSSLAPSEATTTASDAACLAFGMQWACRVEAAQMHASIDEATLPDTCCDAFLELIEPFGLVLTPYEHPSDIVHHGIHVPIATWTTLQRWLVNCFVPDF